MSELVGFNFENQRMTPDAYGRTLENTFTDGILSGCAMAYSGTTFTVKAGYLVVGGREMQFPADTAFTIDQATSGYARIVIKIDLSKTATVATFNQIDTVIEYSSTLNGFRSLSKEDINGSGSVYEVVLAVVSLSSGGISNISSKLAEVAVAKKITPESLDRAYLSIGNRIAIASGDDLNDYTTVGCYGSGNDQITNSLDNCPVTGVVFGLDVAKTYGGTTTTRPSSGAYYITQTLKLTGGTVWRRGGSQTGSALSWSKWERDLTTADLCSPVVILNSTNPSRTITAADAGKTFATTANISYTVNLSTSEDANIPANFEVTVNLYYGTKIDIIFPSGVYVLHENSGVKTTGAKYSITTRGAAVVLKKMFTLSGVSYWIVIGKVEVVS